jgi:hypothetical protein
MVVFYTLVGGPNPMPADIVDPGIAPREGEWVVQRGPDKFLGSPLEERLKAHGIKTVIATGTSAQIRKGEKTPLQIILSHPPLLFFVLWHGQMHETAASTLHSPAL